jgi:hypothetical protein
MVAAPAHAATSPTPDPAPTGGVRPDPAPTTTGGTVAPIQRTPTVQTQAPSRTSPTVQRSQPVSQPTPNPGVAAAASHAIAAAPRSAARSRPEAKPKHAAKPKHRAHAAEKPRHVAVHSDPPIARALFAAPAVLDPGAFGGTRAAAGRSLSDGDLVAAGLLLLLFVGAAASVLRLSVRLTDDVRAGRFG